MNTYIIQWFKTKEEGGLPKKTAFSERMVLWIKRQFINVYAAAGAGLRLKIISRRAL